MKQHLLLILGSVLMFSCSVQFREPLCQDDELHFPREHAGVYRALIPEQTLNGEFVHRPLEFAITGEGIAAGRSEGSPILGRMAGGVPYEIGSGVADFRLCKIDGANYLQSKQQNGTYQINGVEFSKAGMTITFVGMDREQLDAAGIPYYRFPTFGYLDGGGNSLNLMMDAESASLIIDNRNLTKEQLSKLFVIGSVGFHLQKLSIDYEEWKKRKPLIELPFSK